MEVPRGAPGDADTICAIATGTGGGIGIIRVSGPRVEAILAARSERALRLAQAQLRGSVSERVTAIRERLVGELAELEARVDFPDERLDFVPAATQAAAVGELQTALAALADSYGRGRLIAE